MTEDTDETTGTPIEFDFSAYPSNTLFHERRSGRDRRINPHSSSSSPGQGPRPGGPTSERRVRKERRRRIDPTTFEKQYSEDELEFMNAMQRFKEQSGKPFPTYAEVIRVAVALGYRKVVTEDEDEAEEEPFPPPRIFEPEFKAPRTD